MSHERRVGVVAFGERVSKRGWGYERIVTETVEQMNKVGRRGGREADGATHAVLLQSGSIQRRVDGGANGAVVTKCSC